MAHTIHSGSNALFWPPQAPGTPDIHAGKRFIHIKQKLIKDKKRGGKGQQKDSNSKRMRETEKVFKYSKSNNQ